MTPITQQIALRVGQKVWIEFGNDIERIKIEGNARTVTYRGVLRYSCGARG